MHVSFAAAKYLLSSAAADSRSRHGTHRPGNSPSLGPGQAFHAAIHRRLKHEAISDFTKHTHTHTFLI